MYLFDSSAVIEILCGNQKVIEKHKDSTLFTINLVFGEVYYYYLRSEKIHEFEKLKMEVIGYTLEHVMSAMRLLQTRKKTTNNFGFVDSIIYTVANDLGFTLLTKDYGFNGLDNVEIIST